MHESKFKTGLAARLIQCILFGFGCRTSSEGGKLAAMKEGEDDVKILYYEMAHPLAEYFESCFSRCNILRRDAILSVHVPSWGETVE